LNLLGFKAGVKLGGQYYFPPKKPKLFTVKTPAHCANRAEKNAVRWNGYLITCPGMQRAS